MAVHVVKIRDTVTRVREYEIEFPVYSKQYAGSDYSDAMIWMRWDENGTKWFVEKTTFYGRNEIEWQISKQTNYKPDRSGVDYHLGAGMFACSREEFDDAVKQAIEFISGAQKSCAMSDEKIGVLRLCEGGPVLGTITKLEFVPDEKAMKYWARTTDRDTDANAITLSPESVEADSDGRILCITEDPDGFRFAEQCDDWFSVTMSPEEAIEALQEAIAWIRQNVRQRDV